MTAVLFFYEWQLALIALAITPMLVALAYRYSHVSHPTLRDVQQKLADVATVAEENIVGVHVVKSFAQEPQEQAKFERRSEARLPRRRVARTASARSTCRCISFMPLLAQAAVLLVGAQHGRRTATLSTSAPSSPSTCYLGMLVMPLRLLGMWIGQAQRATASGERIFQVMDEPEEIAERPGAVELPPGAGRSASSTCTSSTLEGRPVLDGHRPRRRRPAGRSRSSATPARARRRSTSLVPRFYDVTAGRVMIDGVDVRDVDADLAAPRDRRHLAGSVPLLGDGAREHRLRRRRTRPTSEVEARRGSRRRTSSSSSCRTATTR